MCKTGVVTTHWSMFLAVWELHVPRMKVLFHAKITYKFRTAYKYLQHIQKYIEKIKHFHLQIWIMRRWIRCAIYIYIYEITVTKLLFHWIVSMQVISITKFFENKCVLNEIVMLRFGFQKDEICIFKFS